MLTNPKGMDELFWNKEFEDVLNQTKRLEMAFKVQGYDEIKLFKIIRLNIRSKTQDWYKKLQPTPIDQNEMKIRMQQKFGDVDLDEVMMKMMQLSKSCCSESNYILISLTSYS